jgi:protein SCO1/2
MPRSHEASRVLARGLAFAFAIGLAAVLIAPARAGLDARAALERSGAVIGQEVPDFTLTGTDGRRVTLAQFRGRPLLVSFVYTACGESCPTATRFLADAVAQARAVVGPESFEVVSIGFNQPFDTPPALHRFARQNGIDDARWHFLAPSARDVEALTAAFGFSYAPTLGRFDHVTQVTLVDARGRIVRQVYGEAFPVTMLVAPLKAMVTGTALPAQDVGGWLERLRILCTIYDPRSGRYRLDYGLFIELFAGITFLAGTAWYVVHEWRRRRRRPTMTAARQPC